MFKNWIDYKLMWNESEYGGIHEIRLPYDKIWKPVIYWIKRKYKIFKFQIYLILKDIILYNNADALASLSQISTHMIIFSNGNQLNFFKLTISW